MFDHKSSYTFIRANRVASIGRHSIQLYIRLVNAYFNVVVCRIDIEEMLKQGATSSKATCLLSRQAQASRSSHLNLFCFSRLFLSSFTNNAKREKRITLTLKAFSFETPLRDGSMKTKTVCSVENRVV
jgi:hypothetical protein